MTIDIDKEYDSWLQEQANLLKQNRLEELDVKNLIEELEALVRGEKSAVESLAYQIILHLLLAEFWDEQIIWNKRHWLSEVEGFQFQLNNKLTTNLIKHLNQRLDSIYQKARKAAATKSNIEDFPRERCYSLEQILGNNDDN